VQIRSSGKSGLEIEQKLIWNRDRISYTSGSYQERWRNSITFLSEGFRLLQKSMSFSSFLYRLGGSCQSMQLSLSFSRLAASWKSATLCSTPLSFFIWVI